MSVKKEKLKAVIQELGETISNSVLQSEDVQLVLKRIKEWGYQIDLSLAIGVGLYKEHGNESENILSNEEDLIPSPALRFEFNEGDLEFLNSLNIKINKEEY